MKIQDISFKILFSKFFMIFIFLSFFIFFGLIKHISKSEICFYQINTFEDYQKRRYSELFDYLLNGIYIWLALIFDKNKDVITLNNDSNI